MKTVDSEAVSTNSVMVGNEHILYRHTIGISFAVKITEIRYNCKKLLKKMKSLLIFTDTEWTHSGT